MVALKTYECENLSILKLPYLHQKVMDSNSVLNFSGMHFSMNYLQVLGESILDEEKLDQLVKDFIQNL